MSSHCECSPTGRKEPVGHVSAVNIVPKHSDVYGGPGDNAGSSFLVVSQRKKTTQGKTKPHYGSVCFIEREREKIFTSPALLTHTMSNVTPPQR